MSTTCDTVAERVALGEPLGDAAEHAESCPRCRRIAALPAELGVTRREADPGLGFSARMTAGAQQRITVRRRRRIASGLAVAVATTMLGVFAVAHHGSAPKLAQEPPRPAVQQHQKDPWNADEERDEPAGDDDVRALVQLANTEHAMKTSADWASLKKPLTPYRALLEGVDP